MLISHRGLGPREHGAQAGNHGDADPDGARHLSARPGADKYYAVAVKGHDEKAGKDPQAQGLIEDGIAELDTEVRRRRLYAASAGRTSASTLLQQIEATPFFQTVRGGLVVGLYNQKEVWPIFGYEGESSAKGGYIDRGFNDIEWL